MVRKAFDTWKRFLCFPKVSCAGGVGTIMHHLKDDGVETPKHQALVLWLLVDESNAIVKITKIWRTQHENMEITYLRF